MLSESSVFIGLAAPPGMGHVLSLDREIRLFLRKYRRGLLGHIHAGPARERLKDFYKPANYILLGPFDIATLALVDDFDLGCAAFHPLDQHWPCHDNRSGLGLDKLLADRRSFFHQTIMGPMPRFSPNPDRDPGRLAALALHRATLPLLGICQFKLQNALLIGAGADFMRSIVKAIRRRFDSILATRSDYFHDKVQLLILESHSWHELTLLLFARSFEDILRFVLEVREWTVADLAESLTGRQFRMFKGEARRRPSATADWIQFLGADTFSSSYCDSVRGRRRPSVEASHVFWNSTTTLGFRVELCTEGKGAAGLLDRVCEKDTLYETRNWSVRPGHIHSALAQMLGEKPEIRNVGPRFLLSAGRADVVHPLPGSAKSNSRELVKNMVAGIGQPAPSGRAGRHVVARRTSICYPGVDFGLHNSRPKDHTLHLPVVDDARHPSVHRVLDALPLAQSVRLCVGDIRKEILVPLKKYGVPKVVGARLLNAYALLAQGLQDQFLVSNILELLPHMQRIREMIGRLDEVRNPTELLEKLANDFELAWHNRFRTGWQLGDVSDFTLEYKGGVQQLISAFDSAYKALCAVLAGTPDTIALVTPDPTITSTQTSIRLNYHDIFTPEFFAARGAHEAAELATTFDPGHSETARRLRDGYPALARDVRLGESTIDRRALLRRQVLADICQFHTTYLRDPRLFAYWMRGCFIVEPKHWEPGGKRVRHQNLEEALFRLAAVIFTCPGTVTGRAPAGKANDKLAAFVTKCWSELTAIGGDWVLKNVNDDVWRPLVEKFCNRKPLDPWGIMLTEAHRWGREAGGGDRGHAAILSLAREYEEAFRAGFVPRINSVELADAQSLRTRLFNHTVALNHAFLRLLMEEATAAKEGNLDDAPRYRGLLRRNKQGIIGWSAGTHRADGKLLFDPRGGSFTWDADFRGRYFKYRCAYMASLADMAAKAKVHIPALREAIDVVIRDVAP